MSASSKMGPLAHLKQWSSVVLAILPFIYIIVMLVYSLQKIAK